MRELTDILQSITPVELGTLLVAVVAYHVLTRIILQRWSGPLREQEAITERVKERIAELEPFPTVTEQANETMRIHEEEGTSPRPVLTFLAALLTLFVAAFLAVSGAFWALDGPLAQVIWWVGPVYLGVRYSVNLVRTYRTSDEPGMGALLGGALAGGFIMIGFAITYAFLPVGTIAFLLLSSIFSAIAWRIAPPAPDNLPPVAMLFM